MVRRRCLIGRIALLGVLAVLALPASGSAFSGVPILLTANGPSPAVLTMGAGGYPLWINQDTVAHTVVFTNGRCSVQVQPGEVGGCPTGGPSFVGDYPYTVDGTTQASVVVAAERRTVTLGARSHRIDRGSALRIHGQLTANIVGPPVFEGPRQPVIVLARPDRHHAFHRIAVVIAKPHRANPRGALFSVWQLHVRPGTNKIYIAEANSQPKGGQYWQRAWSRPFRVRVGR